MPTVTLHEAFDRALQHFQAGRLAEAESVCRQILDAHPDQAGTLHLLGLVARQSGRSNEAIECLRRAVALDPQNPISHFNLGNAFQSQARLAEAAAEYRRALDVRPDYAEAANNLGAVLAAQKQFAEAAVAYRQALQHQPDSAEILANLGSALTGLGQFDAAIDAHRRAIQSRPNFPAAHNHLANVFKAQGHLDEAIAEYRRAVALAPNYAEACHNLGAALVDQGRPSEAVTAYQRALQLQPAWAETHTNLGNAFVELKQFDAAIAAHLRALELRPDYPEARNNLGNALEQNGQSEDAIVAYRRALALRPDYHEAHFNLGNTLADSGQLDEGIAEYRRALALAPGDFRIHSLLILRLHLHPHADGQTIVDEQQRWNQQVNASIQRPSRPHTNHPDPERRLRLGYVSPDFRDHVVAFNLRPLFRCHDREHFEIVCYSAVVHPDSVTHEFQQQSQLWRHTAGLSEDALADLVQEDQIDILIDLAQHSTGNRLPVFARRPAPVQVSFVGYPESTGLAAISYRLTDRWLEAADVTETEIRHSSFVIRHSSPSPESTADLRTSSSDLRAAEQPFLLPSFWCYEPQGVDLPVNDLPALKNGYVTFGSLNNFTKINEPLLKLWARVLAALPGSQLVLLCSPGGERRRTAEFLCTLGIDSPRLEFELPRPREEYLQLYHRLDLILDTFPYNGHTTSLDALWMGVPVVSLAGPRPVSRAGLSQLSNIGLPDLVAFSEDDFTQIAVSLARNLPRLVELRTTLRSRLRASVLMDPSRFTHLIETAYRTMWRRWCAASPPIPTP